MVYAQGFEHDIFISYAWDDNQDRGEGKGWIDYFETVLKSVLKQEFGVQNSSGGFHWTAWNSNPTGFLPYIPGTGMALILTRSSAPSLTRH